MGIARDDGVVIFKVFTSLPEFVGIDFQALVVDLIGGLPDDTVDGIGMLGVMNQMMKALLHNIIEYGVHGSSEFKTIGGHRGGVLVGFQER